jgi:hypothetical protein
MGRKDRTWVGNNRIITRFLILLLSTRGSGLAPLRHPRPNSVGGTSWMIAHRARSTRPTLKAGRARIKRDEGAPVGETFRSVRQIGSTS